MYAEGWRDAAREARQRQLVSAVASVVAVTAFNLGRRKSWW